MANLRTNISGGGGDGKKYASGNFVKTDLTDAGNVAYRNGNLTQAYELNLTNILDFIASVIIVKYNWKFNRSSHIYSGISYYSKNLNNQIIGVIAPFCPTILSGTLLSDGKTTASLLLPLLFFNGPTSDISLVSTQWEAWE